MKRLYLCLIFIMIALPAHAERGTIGEIKDIEADTVTFSPLDPDVPCQPYMLKANVDDGTLDVCTNIEGHSIQIGQEIAPRVVNKSGQTITNGQIVNIEGAQGNRIAVGLANAVDPSVRVIGMATSNIANNATGPVTLIGKVRGIDTRTFSAGDYLYLSTTVDGGLVNSVPDAPNRKVFIGVAENSTVNGSVWVVINNGRPIGGLHDVTLSTSIAPVANNILAHNGTAWTNTSDIIVNSITYEPVYWDDLRFPATGVRVGPSFPPSFTTYGLGNLIAPEFIDSADRFVHISAQMPHGYKLGTNLDGHIHFTSGNNTNTGNIEWVGECSNIADIGGTWTGTSIFNAVTTLDGTAQKHYYMDMGDLDGSAITGVSAMFSCRINRNTSVAGDATGSVWLEEIDLHYQLNAPGSKTELAK